MPPPFAHATEPPHDHAERRKGGFTHTVIMEFESVYDRDWYVTGDPAHDSYKAWLRAEGITKVLVTDFEDGVY